MKSFFTKMFWSFVIGAGLTGLSYGIGFAFGKIDSVDPLEAFSVWTSYACTLLCVLQSRLNYPIGAISVAALCALFYKQGLYGSMVLQIYLFPTLLYGWFRWKRDEITRPVTFVGLKWWPVYIALTGVLGYGLTQVNTWMGGTNAALDTWVMILSILAQFLMDNKKWENWAIWAIVDIISVIDYYPQGMFVLSIQMGLFILNALWGAWEWYKTNQDDYLNSNTEILMDNLSWGK